MPSKPVLLNDQQIEQYLLDGYVILQPHEISDSVHDGLFEAAQMVIHEARGEVVEQPHINVIGDNLRARIPALTHLLTCDTVQGALQSVLGANWLLHPHNFIHATGPHDQSFHQDGILPWNDRSHYRTHRPNWCMIFYYPQETDSRNGPTEVLSGTQYWTTDFEKPDGSWYRGDSLARDIPKQSLSSPNQNDRELPINRVVASLGISNLKRVKIQVPKGGMVLTNYDIMHRGTGIEPDFEGMRFMYKFHFFRTEDPIQPSWNNQKEHLQVETRNPVRNTARSIWYWMQGNRDWGPRVTPSDQLDEIACAKSEDKRVSLAYEIGWLARQHASYRQGISALLTHEKEAVRRAAGYALGQTGQRAESVFLKTVNNADPRTRRAAVMGAGEARLTSTSAIEALFERSEIDQDDLVRTNAIYALANIARNPKISIDADRFIQRMDPDVEAVNTSNGGMPRSTIRESLAYALCNMHLSQSQLAELAKRGLRDHDRYVRGITIARLEAAAKSAKQDWIRMLVEHLVASQFSPNPRLV